MRLKRVYRSSASVSDVEGQGRGPFQTLTATTTTTKNQINYKIITFLKNH